MKQTSVSISVESELDCLNTLYEEARPHFLQVEGRVPLKPLEDIREMIGNPPEDELLFGYTIYYGEEIAGYAWLLEKPNEYYYLLHFYIGNAFKRKGIGKHAVLAFDTLFKQKGISRSELMVSGSNYLGLSFWVSIGYNHIMHVEAPEENSPTTSVELELGRQF